MMNAEAGRNRDTSLPARFVSSSAYKHVSEQKSCRSCPAAFRADNDFRRRHKPKCVQGSTTSRNRGMPEGFFSQHLLCIFVYFCAEPLLGFRRRSKVRMSE